VVASFGWAFVGSAGTGGVAAAGGVVGAAGAALLQPLVQPARAPEAARGKKKREIFIQI